MRFVEKKRGRTRDGGNDGGDECGEGSGICWIKDEGGSERTLGGHDRAGGDKEEEGDPRGHRERGGERERGGRGQWGESICLEEKAAAKDDKQRTRPGRCQCHPDSWNAHGIRF